LSHPAPVGAEGVWKPNAGRDKLRPCESVPQSTGATIVGVDVIDGLETVFRGTVAA